MSYTSFVFFIAYFGITYLLYSVFPQKAKWCVLLVGSWVFYTVATKGYVAAIIASSILVWAVGLLIQKLNDTFKEKRKLVEKSERKKLKAKYKSYKLAVLMAGVVLNFGILIFLKYFNFLGGTINSLFGSAIPELSLIQPLGISFYTLQAVSYITDIYRGKYSACKNPLRISLYLSFMLTVVEGPVARYDQLGTQLNQGAKFSFKNFSFGAQLIVWGLFKKVVIADRASELVNNVFNHNEKYGGIVVIVAVLFYTLQLYCEFSGVMDVVNGFGEMLGIEMPANFSRPFFAKSINEFWQRWHITLGAWLRDYIFYPISLSKPFMKLTKSARKRFNSYYANLIPTSVALFFVWFANGMWHGAGWKYIFYGLYYYGLMMLGLFFEPISAKLCRLLKINRNSKPFHLFQMLRTFVIVNGGMLVFRANGLRKAIEMFVSIFTDFSFEVLRVGSKNGLGLDLKDYAIVLIGVVIIFIVGLLNERNISIREKIAKLPFVVKFIVYMLAILVIVIFGAYGDNYGVQDLIYANF